jgi:hypothetical protein
MNDECKDEFDRKISENIRSNLKLFWKSLRMRRGTANSELKNIRDQDGCILKKEESMLKRWMQYFESLKEKVPQR